MDPVIGERGESGHPSMSGDLSCLANAVLARLPVSYATSALDWHKMQESAFRSYSHDTLWSRALYLMSLTHTSSEFVKLDILCPRVILWPSNVDNSFRLVRSSIESELQVLRSLEQPMPAWDSFSIYPEKWRRMVAHVALHKDLSDGATIEWLLIANAVLVSLHHIHLDEVWLRVLFDSLVAMAHRLRDTMVSRLCDESIVNIVFASSGHSSVLLSSQEEELDTLWACIDDVPVNVDVLSHKTINVIRAKPILWTRQDDLMVESVELMSSHKAKGNAMTQWMSWLFDEPMDRMSKRVALLYSTYRKISDICLGDLTSRVSTIVGLWQSIGQEPVYESSQEWSMLDDPLRQTIVPFVATWHNTVHPLQELVSMHLMPECVLNSWYIAARLACWSRQTSQISADQSMLGWSCSLPRRHGGIKSAPPRPAVYEQVGEKRARQEEKSDEGERCKASSLMDKLRQVSSPATETDKETSQERGREQEMAASESFFEEDEALRSILLVGGVDDTSSKDWQSMLTMVCYSIDKNGWQRVLSMLPNVTLGSWRSQLLPYASVGAHVCRGHFEDMCRLVRMVPLDILLSEREKMQGNGGIMQLEGSLIYWCALLMRHGPLSKAVRKYTRDVDSVATAADALMSSLSSISIAFAPEQAESNASLYSNKQTIIWTLLGSLACSWMIEMGKTVSVYHLAVVLLAQMSRPGWMCLEDEWILWRKIMDTIKSDCQTVHFSRFAWVHEWLDKITVPVSNPDESGILLTTDAIMQLAARANIMVPSSIMSSFSSVSSSVSSQSNAKGTNAKGTNAKVAFGSLGKKKMPVEFPYVIVPYQFSLRGAKLLMSYVWHLVDRLDSTVAVREELKRDASHMMQSLVSSDTVNMIVTKWLRWVDQESYAWLDAEMFSVGARMSLYGDHPYVRELYWIEWMGRPWYRARNPAITGLLR